MAQQCTRKAYLGYIVLIVARGNLFRSITVVLFITAIKRGLQMMLWGQYKKTIAQYTTRQRIWIHINQKPQINHKTQESQHS
jgi:hypothetical protein